MPKLSKLEFAELVRSMPGASEDEIFAAAKQRETAAPAEPSTAQKVWDFANKPLTDLPSRLASKAADQIDTPTSTSEMDTINIPGVGPFSSRGFVAGITKGAGDVASSLTSPLNLAMTALGLGGEAAGARGMLGISKAARVGEAALSAPLVAEGAANAYQGVEEGDFAKAGAGAVEAAGGLTGMKGAQQHAFPPAKVRDAYMKSKGRLNEPTPRVEALDPQFSSQVADAYQAMPHDPENPAVKAAYQAMSDETSDQFKFLRDNAGVKMEPWTSEGQPYKNSAEMMADVQKNNRLFYFPSEAGYGPNGEAIAHPLLQTGKSGVPVNDEFRAAHDYFGHAVEGNQFGPLGEERAYQAHRSMFPPEAVPALTSETRGQNSWVNFGEHLRREDGSIPKKGEPGFVPPQNRPFAEQKAGLLPEEFNKQNPVTNPLKTVPGAADAVPAVKQMAGDVPPEFHAVEPEAAPQKKGLTPEIPNTGEQPLPLPKKSEFLKQKESLDTFRRDAAAARGEQKTREGLGTGQKVALTAAAVAPTNDDVVDPVLDFFDIKDDEIRKHIKLGLHAMQLAGAGMVGATALRDIKSPVTLANALATGRLATGKSPAYVAKLLRRGVPGLNDKQIFRAIEFGKKKAAELVEQTGGKINSVEHNKALSLAGAQNKNWYREGPMLIQALKDEGHITNPEEQRVWEGLIGSFGSQNPPKGNFRDAWEIFNAWKRGEAGLNNDGTIRLPHGWSAETPGVDNATRVFGGDEPGGRKINTYGHQNAGRRLMKAVLDRWEGRGHGFAADSRPGLGDVSNPAYEVMEQTKKQVAKELGWKTDQVQAASWAGTRDAHFAERAANDPASWKKPQQGYPMLQQYRLLQAEDKLINQGLLVRKEKSMHVGKGERAKNPDAIETTVEFTPEGKKVFDPAIKAVYDLTREHGGASVNLKTGAFSDQPMAAVSMFPERTLKIPKGVKFTPNHIKGFIMDNLDLLGNENLSVGTWVNKETGQTVLDISATVSNEADNYLGRHLGQKYGQEAIYDFAAKSEISTGGKGYGSGDEPHLYERLKDVSTENLRRLLVEREGALPQANPTPAVSKKQAVGKPAPSKKAAPKPKPEAPSLSMASGIRYLPKK